jgi:hypothetical protein
MCGITYSKVLVPHQHGEPSIAFVRTDTAQVYLRTSPVCSDPEWLLYDFDLLPGDTMNGAHWGGPQLDSTLFVVTHVDSVTHGDVTRKRLTVSYDRQYDGTLNAVMYWIAGIGSTLDPFYPLKCLHDGCESTYELTCVDSVGGVIYPGHSPDSCIIPSGAPSVDREAPTFHPVPFHGTCRVNLAGHQTHAVDVVASDGSVVKSYPHPSQELVIGAELSPGLYLVRITGQDHTTTVKILKAR